MKKEIPDLQEFSKRVNACGAKIVAVQGIGFVGSAMCAAISRVRGKNNQPLYYVIGVDLPNDAGIEKINLINQGICPLTSSDLSMSHAFKLAHTEGNLIATHDVNAYALADIVIVDIHLDIHKKNRGDTYQYHFTYESYLNALRVVLEKAKQDVLLILETTVPPGTTEKFIYPLAKNIFAGRGMNEDQFHLVHSYERVMPGPNYLNSIINFYRVFSGVTPLASQKARAFFESFINTKDFPLSELASPRASEMAKVLENSYRAMNIAFMQEWTEFADKAGVNLYEVIDCIRKRETHKNMMTPGLGVGGYCLTKDSLLADWAYMNTFQSKKHLDRSLTAISVNDLMPEYTFTRIQEKIPSLKNKTVGVLGVSYLANVGDTRFTPTEYLYELLLQKEAKILLHDSYVRFWQEKNISVEQNLAELLQKDLDVLIFAVRHSEYLELDFSTLFKQKKPSLIVDTNNVISKINEKNILDMGIDFMGIGKGI